jgi:hypothetical protein
MKIFWERRELVDHLQDVLLFPSTNMIRHPNLHLYNVCNVIFTMRKRGVLQLDLQLNFWVTLNTCNSPYLYAMNAIEQVVRVVRVATNHIYNAIHYNSITTLSQQLLFNYYATPHDYNHNVMLTSFFIHPSKFNTCIMKIFCDFFEILISIVHYDYSF